MKWNLSYLRPTIKLFILDDEKGRKTELCLVHDAGGKCVPRATSELLFISAENLIIAQQLSFSEETVLYSRAWSIGIATYMLRFSFSLVQCYVLDNCR